MLHGDNHRKPVVDQAIKSLATSVLLLAVLFLWNRLHVGSCLALGLPALVCLTACYGIFTYRLERKRFALAYWLDPGSSLHAWLKRRGMTAVISLFLSVSLTGVLAIFTALARRTDWYFICAIAVATPLVFTALRIWPGRHFRQTGTRHTALADILTARLAGWLVFAGVAAGYIYANYYLPVPGEYIYPDSLERTVGAFAALTGSACPVVDDTLRIAAILEGLSWYSLTTGASLAAMSRELTWLVWTGFFLNTSVVFIGFIRSLEGAILLACRTARPRPDVQHPADSPDRQLNEERRSRRPCRPRSRRGRKRSTRCACPERSTKTNRSRSGRLRRPKSPTAVDRRRRGIRRTRLTSGA